MSLLSWFDLRHINLFKELELLKEFEKRESTYTTRYTSKKNERKEMDTKVWSALCVRHVVYSHTYLHSQCSSSDGVLGIH